MVALLLEQVARYLLGDEGVIGLRGRIHDACEHLIHPARDVVVEGSLEELTERDGAEMLVRSTIMETNVALDKGVALAEGGRGESLRDGGRHFRIVAHPVSAGRSLGQVVERHRLVSNEHGQVFIHEDVLDSGGLDVASLMIDAIVVPVRI